jgi:hypothetical protein
VATVFGVLLSGGVLLGLMALVVDVGQLYVERGELQSGADAAALAVARACATNTPDCHDLPAVTALAQRYLDDNASDGVSKLDVLCGRLPFEEIDCPAEKTNLTACLGSLPDGGNYVEVRAVTEMADGRLVLPPTFAQAVFEDFDGVAVGACGRAGWQLRIDVPLLGIAMFTQKTGSRGPAKCDFARVEDGDDVVIRDVGRCNPPDWPGAVLGYTDARCEVVLPDDAEIGGHVLSDPWPIAGDCEKRLHQGITDGKVVYLPVYDDVRGDVFHIVGAIGVVITGYVDRTDDADPQDNVVTTAMGHRCDGPNSRCISMRVISKIGPFALVGRSTLGLIG